MPVSRLAYGGVGVARREYLDHVELDLPGDQIALVAHGLIEPFSQFRFGPGGHEVFDTAQKSLL